MPPKGAFFQNKFRTGFTKSISVPFMPDASEMSCTTRKHQENFRIFFQPDLRGEIIMEKVNFPGKIILFSSFQK